MQPLAGPGPACFWRPASEANFKMYYAGLGSGPQSDNYIGVAFSNDGMSWKKFHYHVP